MRCLGAAGFFFSFIVSILSMGSVSAGPLLLMDPQTGLVLYSEDADVPWQPASLTKLMTAYLTFEAIRDGRLSPEDVVSCSERAFHEPPSKVGLPLGGQMKVDLAVKVLIVKSANDVAIMLAEKIGGTEANFVEMMNTTAKRLGMTNTHFVNPNGLPMKNPDGTDGPHAVTSARDMAILASMILKEFPQYTELFAMPSVRVGNRMLNTHNSLLKTYDGADGMKTGFVCASGYNVVATATHDGRKLLAVVLGEHSGYARAVRAAGMFEYGFSIYPWKTVFASTLATMPVETAAGADSPDLRSVVCRPRAAIRRGKHGKGHGKKKAPSPKKKSS